MDTTQLLNKLYEAQDIQAFLCEHEREFYAVTLSEMLQQLLAQKNATVAQVADASGQGEYVYKVFQGKRKPSRDIVIAIAIGMQLSCDETQLLLRIAKLARLDPRDKRDSVLIYGLKETLGVDKLNELLYEMQEVTL